MTDQASRPTTDVGPLLAVRAIVATSTAPGRAALLAWLGRLYDQIPRPERSVK